MSSVCFGPLCTGFHGTDVRACSLEVVVHLPLQEGIRIPSCIVPAFVSRDSVQVEMGVLGVCT